MTSSSMTSSYISLFVHKKCISLFAFLIPLCFVKMGSTRKTCPKNCRSRKSEAGKSEWTPEMLWFCRPLGSNIANCSYHPKKYGEFSECRFSLIFHVREIVYMEHRDVQLWFFLNNPWWQTLENCCSQLTYPTLPSTPHRGHRKSHHPLMKI